MNETLLILQTNIQYCLDQSQKCQDLDEDILYVQQSFEGVIKIYRTDCVDKDQIDELKCFDPNESHQIFIKQENSQNLIKYKGKIEKNSILQFVRQFIIDHTLRVNQSSIDFFFKYKSINKILFFGDTQETPYMLKLLQLEFKDRLTIGYALLNDTWMIMKFQVSYQPFFLAFQFDLKYNYYQKIHFTGNSYSYLKVQKFCKDIANKKIINESQLNDINNIYNYSQEKDILIKLNVSQQVRNLILDNYKEELIIMNEQPALIFIYEHESELVNKTREFLKMKYRFGKMFNYAIVQYNSQLARIKNYNNTKQISSKRKIRYLPFGTDKLRSHHFLSQEISMKKMILYLSQNIPDNTLTISPSSDLIFYQEVQEQLKQNRATIILFHNQKETLLTFKFFSNIQFYQNKLIFYSCQNPTLSLIQEYKIDKFPFILLFMQRNNQLHSAIYKNQIHYDNLIVSLNQIYSQLAENDKQLKDQTLQQKILKEQEEEAKFKRKVQIQSQLDFEQCNEQFVFCVILMVENIGSLQTFYDFGILDVIQEHNTQQSIKTFIGYIDTKCHDYLYDFFEIDINIRPQFIIIYPKLNLYIPQIGTFTIDHYIYTISQIISKKAKFFKIKKQIQIESKNCQNFFNFKQSVYNKQYETDEEKKINEELEKLNKKKNDL